MKLSGPGIRSGSVVASLTQKWVQRVRVCWVLCCCCLVAESCPTLLPSHRLWPTRLLCHGVLQARILEWIAISLSRGSSWPRDQTCVSCIAGGFFTTEPPGKPIAFINAFNFEHCWLGMGVVSQAFGYVMATFEEISWQGINFVLASIWWW